MPAASPPTSIVCTALRHGTRPVNWPLTQPKTTSASSVTRAERSSALATGSGHRYGSSGTIPPAMYDPPIVSEECSARC